MKYVSSDKIITNQIAIIYIGASKIIISSLTKISRKFTWVIKMKGNLIEWVCIGNKQIIISRQIMN